MPQTSRLKTPKRKTSRWNAFLSQEMERRNASLPEGTDRKNVSEDMSREIAAIWATMSEEERTAATEDRMKVIEQRREGREKRPIQPLNDARATLAKIETELEALHARTGIEFLLFAVKSRPLDFKWQPYIFYTDKRLADFVTLTTKNTVQDFAARMEGYCVSGIDCLKQSSGRPNRLLTLKAEAARIINEKLSIATHGGVARMQYTNFDTHITEVYGLIIHNWPLNTFRAPGELSSATELQALVDAWSTDATRFHELSAEELKEWRLKRHRLAIPGTSDSTINDDAPLAGERGSSSSAPSPSPLSEAPTAPLDVQPSTSNMTAVPLLLPSGTNDNGSLADMLPRKRARAEEVFVTMDVVTGPDGRAMAVAKRQRKERSDKGSTRTRKQKNTRLTSANAPLDGAVGGGQSQWRIEGWKRTSSQVLTPHAVSQEVQAADMQTTAV